MAEVFAASGSGVIVSGYSGPIVELRANVNSALQDFKFAAGVLVTDDVNEDTVADWLTSQAGSPIALCRTAHNQAGGNDAIQPTDSNQPFWVVDTGESGKWAMDFDGTNYLEIADGAAFDITDQIALSCWVKRDSAGASAALFSKRNAGATNLAYQLAIVNVGSSDVLRFAARDGTGVWTLDSTGGFLEDTNWHFVGFSLNTSTGAYNFNIDGTTRGSGTTARLLAADNEVLRIGNDHASAFLAGLMDDPRVENAYRTDWSGPSSQRGWIAAGAGFIDNTNPIYRHVLACKGVE